MRFNSYIYIIDIDNSGTQQYCYIKLLSRLLAGVFNF